METPSRMLVPQCPHFFKVITFPSDQGLKIPVAFMRKYGDELQEFVLLEVPTGVSWRIELIHYGDRTLLDKGWQEFAEFYSIDIDHFLVFRYVGNSRFHVLIFDPTAMEIEYPSNVNNEIRSGNLSPSFCERSISPCVGADSNTNDEVEEEEEILDISKDDVSIEIIDQFSECKSRVSSRTRSSRRLKENKHSKTTKAVKTGEKSAKASKIYREKIKRYQESKSSRPFFITIMQPSHVSFLFRLDIPKNFRRQYLSINKNCKFMFHVSGDMIRKWPVNLHVYQNTGRVRITHGFSKFVKDNKIEVGDVCVFELGGQSEREFKVTVYRSSELEDEMVA